MGINTALAIDRLEALQALFKANKAYRQLDVTTIPDPEKPWLFQPSALRITAGVALSTYTIKIQIAHQEHKTKSLGFNIKRFGEKQGERLHIYHNGDHSTSARAGTYSRDSGGTLINAIAARYPELRSRYASQLCIGSIPLVGDISNDDFLVYLAPGIVKYVLSWYNYFL